MGFFILFISDYCLKSRCGIFAELITLWFFRKKHCNTNLFFSFDKNR